MLVVEGKLFFKTKTEKSPVKSASTQQIVGVVKNLGGEDEFSLEKEEEIVFQNKADDLPKIKYRISYPGKVVPAQWRDLELRDKVVLTISYDTAGQVESRILKIFREVAPAEAY